MFQILPLIPVFPALCTSEFLSVVRNAVRLGVDALVQSRSTLVQAKLPYPLNRWHAES